MTKFDSPDPLHGDLSYESVRKDGRVMKYVWRNVG